MSDSVSFGVCRVFPHTIVLYGLLTVGEIHYTQQECRCKLEYYQYERQIITGSYV